LAGAQVAEALSGKDLALALALVTAAVSGVSLAWPQTRRPVELPGTLGGDGAPAPAAPTGPEADQPAVERPRPFAYGPLREALRFRGSGRTGTESPPLRAVPPDGPPAPAGGGGGEGPLGGAVVGGSIIGLLKGLFGVGGGFLIVPLMSRLGRFRRDVAVGSSLFAILVASVVAAVRHWTLGNVDGSDLLSLVPGGLFGSFVGARAARSMSPASIRRVFLGVMLASTLYLVLFRSAYK
ncbi:MAG TPA: sulfite exporter TauE/SafE family protein, partial [Acidimicrobiia bacterium]|nr:sulfite exporter TauE/SafE family protein [Acidimicrobiia bacterium]